MLLSLLALPAPASAQQKQACITVSNAANGYFPVELRVPDVKPITFQADVGRPVKLCLDAMIAADQKIEVKVKSWMNPVGICQMLPGGQLDIVRIANPYGGMMNEVRCR